jgi:4-amino-4-deoxy-L-arabinose transferase-like glycosyltransferase
MSGTRRGAVFGLALLLAGLALFLPGRARIPPMDRDESRYMEATAQMLETRDFIDVRFQDQPRYLQPAGIYWLEAASVSLFSDPAARAAWAYRLPALVAALGALLLTGWIGAALFGPEAGLLAGLLLAGSVLLGVESRMATIDAVLLAVVLLAQASLLHLYLRREQPDPAARRVAALHWAALGAGLMLKGPVVLVVSWGTILGLVLTERRAGWLRRLHPLWGIPLMLAVVLPWCIAIWRVSGGAFFQNAVGHNLLGKVATGQQAHGLPPGYYLGIFTAAFWPGSLFALLALPFVWAERHRPAVRFLLCWIVPTWLLFEAVSTKLPHYVLPTYPAIACLAAGAALAPGGWRWSPRWRWIPRVYAGLWLAVAVVLAVAGPVLLWRLERRIEVLPCSPRWRGWRWPPPPCA